MKLSSTNETAVSVCFLFMKWRGGLPSSFLRPFFKKQNQNYSLGNGVFFEV